MRRPAAVFAAVFAAVAPAAALAGVLAVPIDHTVKLSLNGPAASVVVGNPAVADVHVVDSRTVFVAGRGFGTTDITVIDSLGRTVFASEIQVSPPRKGQVAVYRGNARSDLSCDPACGPSVATAGTAASAAAPGAAATAASTAASLPGAIMPAPVLGAVAGFAGPR